MGRQINFYMDEQTKFNFVRFLADEGFLFVSDHGSETQYLTAAEVNQEFLVCLYKKEFGKIIRTIRTTPFTYSYIDRRFNPVIEYQIPIVKHEEKRIIGGRLWLTSDSFLDSNADRDVISKQYNRLVRWIKKEIPYQDVRRNPNLKNDKDYISDSLAGLFCREGYRLE